LLLFKYSVDYEINSGGGVNEILLDNNTSLKHVSQLQYGTVNKSQKLKKR
jgi:hypothetical protein